jgi:hypothetical protein
MTRSGSPNIDHNYLIRLRAGLSGFWKTMQVTFSTFRHWKVTMEYHKTRDILHAKEILGYKSLNNTVLHTQLISFKDDEFTAKVAHSEQKVCQLLEAGFEFVCDLTATE